MEPSVVGRGWSPVSSNKAVPWLLLSAAACRALFVLSTTEPNCSRGVYSPPGGIYTYVVHSEPTGLEARGRAGAGAASASYASCRSEPACIGFAKPTRLPVFAPGAGAPHWRCLTSTCTTKAVFLHILTRPVGCEKQRLCSPWPSRDQYAQLSHPGQVPLLGAQRAKAWAPRVLLSHSNCRSAPRTRRGCGRGCNSTPKPTTPTSQRLTPPSKHSRRLLVVAGALPVCVL
jgi:hypothetical protein